MAYRCDGCGQASSGEPRKTMTNRSLCPDCHDQLLGASAGVIAGGGIPGAIATAAWFSRLRRRRRGERPPN